MGFGLRINRSCHGRLAIYVCVWCNRKSCCFEAQIDVLGLREFLFYAEVGEGDRKKDETVGEEFNNLVMEGPKEKFGGGKKK